MSNVKFLRSECGHYISPRIVDMIGISCNGTIKIRLSGFNEVDEDCYGIYFGALEQAFKLSDADFDTEEEAEEFLDDLVLNL